VSIFQSLNTSASALTAQRLKMDVISSNIANAVTTRGEYVDGKWIPYRRKNVEITARGQSSFQNVLSQEMGLQGVQVTKITEDQTPFKQVYEPDHPDANENGYVLMPNVDVTKEMVDLLTASRAYEANVTAFNAGKSMALKALEIGK
jgi:flagellar basal-body rod protein FlgC